MKLILLSDSGRESLTVNMQQWQVRLAVLGAVVAVMLIGATAAGYLRGSYEQWQVESLQRGWQARYDSDSEVLEKTRAQVENELAALTVKVASLQARIIRLDALGERVVQLAKLDKGEFDFSRDPAMGGPIQLGAADKTDVESITVEPLTVGSVYQLLEDLEARVADRVDQLSVLDRQIMAREVRSEAYVTGRPVKWGWLSSPFGYRTDPFNGSKAWHGGVDFAGKVGSDVIAVAGGVVTSSGQRYGYGNMVEINHGNGIVTRYGHNASNQVVVGDIVEKGESIAIMGSTGRSTGPHVHFEVLKNGKPIDPERFIYRASL